MLTPLFKSPVDKNRCNHASNLRGNQMNVDRSAIEMYFASEHTPQYFPSIIHILNSFKISLQPGYILHIVHTPLLMLLCPITSVVVDSAEEMDETGLLKMRGGREKFKLEEALMGPSGHVPPPQLALIHPLQIQKTQVSVLTRLISWLGWRKRRW